MFRLIFLMCFDVFTIVVSSFHVVSECVILLSRCCYVFPPTVLHVSYGVLVVLLHVLYGFYMFQMFSQFVYGFLNVVFCFLYIVL